MEYGCIFYYLLRCWNISVTAMHVFHETLFCRNKNRLTGHQKKSVFETQRHTCSYVRLCNLSHARSCILALVPATFEFQGPIGWCPNLTESLQATCWSLMLFQKCHRNSGPSGTCGSRCSLCRAPAKLRLGSGRLIKWGAFAWRVRASNWSSVLRTPTPNHTKGFRLPSDLWSCLRYKMLSRKSLIRRQKSMPWARKSIGLLFDGSEGAKELWVSRIPIGATIYEFPNHTINCYSFFCSASWPTVLLFLMPCWYVFDERIMTRQAELRK